MSSQICEELQTVEGTPMPDGGCVDCLAMGATWVHLRYCVECSGTHCCDDSQHRHARAHWGESGHPVIRSKEPSENWAYCYDHDVAVEVPS